MVVEDYDMPPCEGCSSYNCKVICEPCANKRLIEYLEFLLSNRLSEKYSIKEIKEEIESKLHNMKEVRP